jgi:hypothetical protein
MNEVRAPPQAGSGAARRIGAERALGTVAASDLGVPLRDATTSAPVPEQAGRFPYGTTAGFERAAPPPPRPPSGPRGAQTAAQPRGGPAAPPPERGRRSRETAPSYNTGGRPRGVPQTATIVATSASRSTS